MHRTPHRLSQMEYARPGAVCSVTTCTLDRRQVFTDAQVASAAVEILRTLADVRAVPVYAYCIMPDHAHLVLEASADCSITDFVGQFKNLAQRKAWAAGVQGRIWQTGFYDHFIRADEQLEAVVWYVLNNPVRREVVPSWRDYPYAGSMRLDVEALGGGTSPPPTDLGGGTSPPPTDSALRTPHSQLRTLSHGSSVRGRASPPDPTPPPTERT